MTTPERCEATAHQFAKFDDATIFCQRCGEQRVMDVQALIAKLPVPTYLPCPGPHWQPVTPTPVYPWQPWQPWWGTTTVTYDTTATILPSAYDSDGGRVSLS